MKKSNTFGKLNLNKSTLSLLNKKQLNTIIGGEELTNTCNINTKHLPTSPVICK